MRAAKIDPKVIYMGMTATNYKSRDISCWTHACHKPYESDWFDARKDAYDKIDSLGLNSDGDYYNMMREKGLDKLKKGMRS
jgi:hypothetical protein